MAPLLWQWLLLLLLLLIIATTIAVRVFLACTWPLMNYLNQLRALALVDLMIFCPLMSLSTGVKIKTRASFSPSRSHSRLVLVHLKVRYGGKHSTAVSSASATRMTNKVARARAHDERTDARKKIQPEGIRCPSRV